MRVRVLAFLLVLGLMMPLAGQAVAQDGQAARKLTSVSIETNELDVRVKLGLSGNNGRSLGKVYYSGETIKVVVLNTKLGTDVKRRLKSPDGLLSTVGVSKHKKDVWVKLKLKKRVQSIMEYLVFEPGLDSSEIVLRKSAFFSALAMTEKEGPPEVKEEDSAAANKAGPKKDLPLIAEIGGENADLVPLVPSSDKADGEAQEVAEAVKSLAGSIEETDPLLVPNQAPKSLDELFADNKAESLEGAAGKALQDKKAALGASAEGSEAAVPAEDSILGVGSLTPDLTNLYIMALVIMLVGGLWFLLNRGRKVSMSGIEGPMKVLKSQNLGGKQKLLLVEVDERRLLLSSTDHDVRLLTELDSERLDEDQMMEAASTANVHPLFTDNSQSQRAVPVNRSMIKHPAPWRSYERPRYFNDRSRSDGGSEYGDSRRFADVQEEEEKREQTLREKLRNIRRGG